jgi:hypothetical protein
VNAKVAEVAVWRWRFDSLNACAKKPGTERGLANGDYHVLWPNSEPSNRRIQLAGRILAGAKPGALPVARSTKFEFVMWVAKYKSGGDRSLKQTAAMWPPRVVVKRGRNS